MSVSSPYTEEFHQSLKEGSQRSAREIIPLVLEFIRPNSVVDVGCGLGTWLSVFKDFGIHDCLGVDGDYIDKNMLEIRAEEFQAYDLQKALEIKKCFDLVVSVEVAEHLPPECADTLLDSLTRLGPVVLFSAAVPLQGGANHVNEQWPGYWAQQFQKRGYCVIDCLRKKLWNNEYVEPWYAQNILIFVRHDCLERYPLLQRESRTDLSQLAMVHPKISRRRSVEPPPDRQPRPSGILHAVRIEITEPISDIVLQAPAERLKCAVELEGTPIGTLELPVCEGLVSGYVLADAIAAEYAWSILGRFFECTVYRELKTKTEGDGISVWRGDLRLAEMLIDPDDEGFKCIHNRAGWTVFLQELWGRPYWPQQRFYESQPEEEGSAQHSVENDCISIEVSQDVPDITIVGPELRVVLEVGGAPLGMVVVPVKQKKASAQELRAALTRAGGLELCRVAVREGLLGRPLEGQARLRERLAATAAIKPRQDGQAYFLKAALLPFTHGVVLGRRAHETIGTSASRRAVLPTRATQDIVATAVAAGEPVISILGPSGNPARLVYAPDVICRQSERRRPSPTSGGVFQAIPKRVPPRNAISAPILTDQIPILLYRRVTPGRGHIKSYDPVTLDAFREHLEYLHDAGFYSIGLGDWRATLERQTPLPRRPVIFTFDGGYLDFLTHAWPVLKHYGFSAMLSLVTDKIGRSNTWDPNYGEEIPVLGWEEMRDLQKEGVEFGSHSASYRPLTSLPLVEVVREAARSRAILEDRLGTPIQTFSYPYGDCDRVVQHLIGACGYMFGLSSRGGPSRFWDSLLDLPRIEITGSDSLQDFVVKVDSKSAVALK